MLPILYNVVKWVHIMLAITALGANITYGIWIARTAKHPEHLPYVLRTIKFIDDRVANPCYVLLLLTGVALAGLLPWPLTTPWLLISIALYVVAVALGFFMYTPLLRRQIEAAEKGGPDSPDYKVVAAQGRQIGIIVAAIVVTIAFLMVTKPGFGA